MIKDEIEEGPFPCPCCGFLTISEPNSGTFEICPICFWEDDNVQFKNPNRGGGANEESLIEARKNYLKFGAISQRFLNDVRKPTATEIVQKEKFEKEKNSNHAL